MVRLLLSPVGLLLLHVAVGPDVRAQQTRPMRLEGTYTVNPDGKGERNFESISAAVRSLLSQGVGGPVVVVLAPNTYREAVVLDPIPGVDRDKTVTFQAAVQGKVSWNGKKVPKVGDRAKPVEAREKKKPGARRVEPPEEDTTIVLGEGVEHVVFDGLVFEETEQGPAIYGHPGASNIEIRNCSFGKGIKGRGRHEGVIHVNGSSKSIAWKIHHCVFDLPSIRTGMYFSQVKEFHIHDNTIKLNRNSSGLYFINENRGKNRIERNLIFGETDGGGDSCAINVALSSLNNDVVDNTIVIESPGHAIRTFGTQTNFNRLYGNLIAVTGGGAGIHVSSGNLNHFESDGNLFFIESKNVGTWNNGLESGLASWREATSAGPRGVADESSCLGSSNMIESVDQLLVNTPPDKKKARLKQVLLLLGTGDEPGKRLAARACVVMGEDARAAIPHLALLCHHNSAGVRADAAMALGAVGSGASIAIPELRKLLDDDNPLVVKHAAATLGNFGALAQGAAPRLAKLTERETRDGSDELRHVILTALRKIDPDNPVLNK